MKRHTADSEELVCKINYVRDWLNKAEDAVNNGDNITAVSKLVLAKADTSVLLAQLVPQAVQAERRMPLLSPSMLRKLAAVTVPVVLAAIFFLGLSFGGNAVTVVEQPMLNHTPAVALHRSVDRPEFETLMLASSKVNDTKSLSEKAVVETVKETPVLLADAKPVIRDSTPTAPKPEPIVVAVEESPDVAIPVSVPSKPEAEEPPMDIFGFSMDIIRSARENAGH